MILRLCLLSYYHYNDQCHMLFSSGTNSLSFVVCSTLLLLYYLVVPTEVKQ